MEKCLRTLVSTALKKKTQQPETQKCVSADMQLRGILRISFHNLGKISMCVPRTREWVKRNLLSDLFCFIFVIVWFDVSARLAKCMSWTVLHSLGQSLWLVRITATYNPCVGKYCGAQDNWEFVRTTKCRKWIPMLLMRLLRDCWTLELTHSHTCFRNTLCNKCCKETGKFWQWHTVFH